MSEAKAKQSLRVPLILSVLVVVLAAVAAAGGLFIPNLYRDNAWVVPQNRGADLVTLVVAVPALFASLVAAGRGSKRAVIVWLGVLGYMLYTYIGATFAFNFNYFYLIYVALLSLSVFAIVTTLANVDVAEFKKRFDTATPRGPIAAFMVLLSIMLFFAYLGQMMPFFTEGTMPDAIVQSGGPTFFVWALDLGFIVPMMIVGSIGLMRRTAVGYLLTGCMLIKAATMGLSLLGMTLFSVLAGTPLDVFFTAIWVFVAVGGLGLSFWFLPHCRG